jgi:hypothetical protein
MTTTLLRVAAGMFGYLCLAWVCFVHGLYFVTLEDDPFERWIAPLRGTPAVYPAVDLLMLQFPVTLLGMALLAVHLRPRVASLSRFGLLAGGLFALWCNTQFLAIPYGGGYPSIPGAMLGFVLTGGNNQGPLYCLTVLVTNVVLWPVVGWLIGRSLSVKRG